MRRREERARLERDDAIRGLRELAADDETQDLFGINLGEIEA